MNPFPKIFHLGDRHIESIWEGEVEITEKLDGSQIAFGIVDDVLHIRSKGAMIRGKEGWIRIIKENDLFYPAVQHILSIKYKFADGAIYYGETLAKPKHNTLQYEKIPKNNIALFGAMTKEGAFVPYDELCEEAQFLDVDIVPSLFRGKILNPNPNEIIPGYLNNTSYLGGPKIEGVVVKNYKEYFVGGQLLPLMAGKFVSEEFKEVHKKNWTKENTSGGKLQSLYSQYNSEARWNKAIQYLRDGGNLQQAPQDIGPLIKRVQTDIIEEEKENIKEALWQIHKGDLLRTSTAGLPEWYKKTLLEK